jgi:ribonuclease P protein component
MGKAHQRNRIKRRMREALRRHVDLLPAGCDLIFHPRRSVLTIEFSQLEREIVRILEQARLEVTRLEVTRFDAARSPKRNSALSAPKPRLKPAP